MNTQRVEVLSALYSILAQDRPAYLVTVLETWGASPRPAGSVLVFDPLGNKVYGSVSGGCVEEDLLEHLCSPESLQSFSSFPCIEKYGADASGHNLPCGASIELLIELFDTEKNDTALDHVKGLLVSLERGESVCRRVDLKSRKSDFVQSFPEQAYGEVWRDSNLVYLRCHAADKLLLIGATDVAYYLSPIAKQLGYRVSICEPRGSFVARQPLFEDVEMVTDMLPDDLVYTAYADSGSAVIALAHDARVDDLGVYAALQGSAHFVGALGSERNAQLRRQRLMELGLSEEQLARLKAPVGLMIGSHTPTEIAISIAAQLVEVRSMRMSSQAQSSVIDKFSGAIDKLLV